MSRPRSHVTVRVPNPLFWVRPRNVLEALIGWYIARVRAENLAAFWREWDSVPDPDLPAPRPYSNSFASADDARAEIKSRKDWPLAADVIGRVRT